MARLPGSDHPRLPKHLQPPSSGVTGLPSQRSSRWVEVGRGRVLGGMLARIDKSVDVHQVEDVAGLDATAAALKPWGGSGPGDRDGPEPAGFVLQSPGSAVPTARA